MAKLGHLGCGHGHAVALMGVACKEVLVVILRWPVIGQRQYFGHDRSAVNATRRHFGDQTLGNGLLFGIGVVNAAAVLGAAVVTLAIQRGGVVYNKKSPAPRG